MPVEAAAVHERVGGGDSTDSVRPGSLRVWTKNEAAAVEQRDLWASMIDYLSISAAHEIICSFLSYVRTGAYVNVRTMR